MPENNKLPDQTPLEFYFWNKQTKSVEEAKLETGRMIEVPELGEEAVLAYSNEGYNCEMYLLCFLTPEAAFNDAMARMSEQFDKHMIELKERFHNEWEAQ